MAVEVFCQLLCLYMYDFSLITNIINVQLRLVWFHGIVLTQISKLLCGGPTCRITRLARPSISVCLFLIHLFSTIISPHECHHHLLSHHQPPHHSSFLTFFTQILPSIDIWHLFGRISWISIWTAFFCFFSGFGYRCFLFLVFIYQAFYLRQ